MVAPLQTGGARCPLTQDGGRRLQRCRSLRACLSAARPTETVDAPPKGAGDLRQEVIGTRPGNAKGPGTIRGLPFHYTTEIRRGYFRRAAEQSEATSPLYHCFPESSRIGHLWPTLSLYHGFQASPRIGHLFVTPDSPIFRLIQTKPGIGYSG
jgi:hypothetical protein